MPEVTDLVNQAGTQPGPRVVRAVARLVTIALLICTIVGVCAPAAAADVVLVRSSDAGPYRIAEDALAEELALRGHPTSIVPLALLTDERLDDLERDGSRFVAIGTSAAVSLNRRLRDESDLIYCLVSDPGGEGLLDRRRTGGISTQVPFEIQLRIISDALPGTRTIGVLYNSESTASRAKVAALAESLPDKWELEATDLKQYETAADALRTLFDAEPDIVWTSPDAEVFDSATIRSLLLTALRKKVPVFGFSTFVVRAGALIGIGIDPQALAFDAAVLADRVVSGGMPEDADARHLAPRYDIAVNLLVADELDIELPKETVARARYQYSRPGKERR